MCSCGVTVASYDFRPPIYSDGITMDIAEKTFGVPARVPASSCYAKNGGSKPCCGLIAFGNYCGRTEEDRLAEARRRMDNRVFFMGITAQGYQEPILEAINPDPKYRDASSGKPEISSFLPNEANGPVDHDKVAENFRSIDVYSGLVDGKNYGRFNRLRQHKIRHTRNPNGTETRFCIPIASSMNYGWWIRDMGQLNKTKWYEARHKAPIVRGDVTKFLDDMFHHDPSFLLF